MDDPLAARVAAGEAWVLEAGDGVAGVLVLVDGPGHVLIESVSVLPDLQKQGHGRALLAFAEERARESGRGEVRLYTHAAMTENLELYPRLGYGETGRSRRHGFERVHFAKRV